MKISIFGIGYVGLVTGACFAKLGNEVLLYDIDRAKVKMLQEGEMPIYEPGLKELVEKNRWEKRIFFTDDAKTAVDHGDIIFIAVGTPTALDGRGVHLGFVEAAAVAIGENIGCNGKIIVNKSTVPEGTAAMVRQVISKELHRRQVNYIFGMASNPEFLREGTAVADFMRPDRIAVGTDEEWVADVMRKLYHPVTKNGHPIVITDFSSAEVSKYVSNTFLAMKVSFMNEVAILCEKTGADVGEVWKIMTADERIGNKFLYPGIGYGGSCFPKDVLGFISMGEDHGCKMAIASAVERVNKTQRQLFIAKIKKEMGKLRGKKVAIWGLAFKPDTDDVREAPSMTVIEELLVVGMRITAYDPEAEAEAKKVFGNSIAYAENMYDCLIDADALVVVTEWPQFKTPGADLRKMKELMRGHIIFDGRNIYSLEEMRKAGFTYVSIGRARVAP